MTLKCLIMSTGFSASFGSAEFYEEEDEKISCMSVCMRMRVHI